MSASDVAIATIQSEHRSLGMVLHMLQSMLSKIAAEHVAADFALLATVLYYIDDFPERCHHPKEDEYLFKCLRLRSTEFDAVLDRLQTEHARSAITVAGLHRALVHYQGGAPEGLRLFKAAVDSYADEMREHFGLEDALMTRARAALREEDWELIAWAFTANDDPLFGSNQRLEFSMLYHRIMVLVPRKIKPQLQHLQAARVAPRPL
jgi:hemerythrin-like domain-containing protein